MRRLWTGDGVRSLLVAIILSLGGCTTLNIPSHTSGRDEGVYTLPDRPTPDGETVYGLPKKEDQ